MGHTETEVWDFTEKIIDILNETAFYKVEVTKDNSSILINVVEDLKKDDALITFPMGFKNKKYRIFKFKTYYQAQSELIVIDFKKKVRLAL